MSTEEIKSNTTTTAKFGWCLTGQHDGCSVAKGDLKCGCSCHSKKEGQKKKSVKRK